jgi:hypothetical protein
MSEAYSRQFENLICELYRRKGYTVEPQKTLVGKSGAKHRLDGYCSKGKIFKKSLAIEAKYSANGWPVSMDDFSRFLTALEDCNIPEGHMITNSYFSENIVNLALSYNVKLVDGSQLKKELKKYDLSQAISSTSVFLDAVCIPFARIVLDSIDTTRTLSKLILPRSTLYIDFSRLDALIKENTKEVLRNYLNQ